MKETPQQRYAKTPKGKASRARAQKKWLAKEGGRETYNKGTRARYLRQKELLSAIKLESGCRDCGFKDHPAALDFDHRHPVSKSFSIGKSYGRYSDKRLLAEASKCDIRCANCHRIRTFT